MVESAAFQLHDWYEGEAGGGDSGEGESEAGGGEGEEPRLRALAAMQLGLLRHALSFPAATVVVYSTCSASGIAHRH